MWREATIARGSGGGLFVFHAIDNALPTRSKIRSNPLAEAEALLQDQASAIDGLHKRLAVSTGDASQTAYRAAVRVVAGPIVAGDHRGSVPGDLFGDTTAERP
jgi:hypothetical protein